MIVTLTIGSLGEMIARNPLLELWTRLLLMRWLTCRYTVVQAHVWIRPCPRVCSWYVLYLACTSMWFACLLHNTFFWRWCAKIKWFRHSHVAKSAARAQKRCHRSQITNLCWCRAQLFGDRQLIHPLAIWSAFHCASILRPCLTESSLFPSHVIPPPLYPPPASASQPLIPTDAMPAIYQ